MRLTAPDNLPVPEASDDVDPLEDWIGDLADAVQKALRRDTGWQNVPLADDSKWIRDPSEPAQYRILNGWCSLRGQFNARNPATLAGGTYGTLPAAASPVGQRVIANPYQGNATILARLIIGTNGSLTFAHNGASVTYVRLDQVSPYLVASA